MDVFEVIFIPGNHKRYCKLKKTETINGCQNNDNFLEGWSLLCRVTQHERLNNSIWGETYFFMVTSS